MVPLLLQLPPPGRHGFTARPSESLLLLTLSKASTVVFFFVAFWDQSVDRMTSANMAVLLVPSCTPVIGTPLIGACNSGREVSAKMPAVRSGAAGTPKRPLDVAPIHPK